MTQHLKLQAMKARLNNYLVMSGVFMEGWQILILLLTPLLFFLFSKFQLGFQPVSFASVISQWMAPMMGVGFIFYHSLFQTDRLAAWSGTLTRVSRNGKYAPLEFYFSHAISRRAIFVAKASWFLTLLSLPWVGYMASACLQPNLRLAVRHGIPAAADLYLTHFPGAFSEPNPESVYGYIVVLPHGMIPAVGSGLLLFLTVLFLYQLCMEVIHNGWLQLGISIVLCLGLPIGLHFLSRLIIWICSNLSLACVGVTILAVAIQGFCCNRFVRREIL